MPAPEPTPVERALKRAQAPERAPRRDAGLGVEATLRELHENVRTYVLILYNSVKIKFTEHDVTTMHAKLAAAREPVLKLIRIRELAACHKLEQMCHLRLLEKLTAWKRDDGFDRNKIIAEKHWRTLRRLYSGDDPKHFHVGVYFDRRRPPMSQDITESMWGELKWLRQELSQSQPPPQ